MTDWRPFTHDVPRGGMSVNASAPPERAFGWLPQLPDARDYRLEDHHPELIQRAAMAALPDIVDFRHLINTLRDQGPLGSCTAFGTLKAIEFLLSQRGQHFDGSELLQYLETRRKLGTLDRDSGGIIRDAIKVAAEIGIAPEQLWPYDPARFRDQPPQAVYDEALEHQALKYVAVPNDVDAMRAVLGAGYPIVVGFSVYANYGDAPGGVWPEPVGAPIAGHCVCLVGYLHQQQRWILGNSWGPGWGDNGYGYMSYGYLQANGADFWMIETVEEEAPAPPAPSAGLDGIAFHFADGHEWIGGIDQLRRNLLP